MSRATATAFVFAAAALVLRVQFVYFPPGDHLDEEIIASLSMRAVETGRLTANWDGFADEAWSRPTYQFSPYTLLENAAVLATNRSIGKPAAFEDHVRFARWFSVAMGAAAVLVCFFAAKAWFGDWRIALLAETLLAVTFLHVQDCCYARVEGMLSLFVGLSVWAAGRAMATPGPRNVLFLGLLIGVTIAAKYNAAPLVLLLAAPWLSTTVNNLSPPNRRRRFGGLDRSTISFIAVFVGFLIATPEVLLHPQPLVEGIRFEIAHYSEGHPPHHAMDWSDNNLKFWGNYFTRLGFGWAPTLATSAFLAAAIRRRGRDGLLAAYLVVSLALLLSSKVRFERNAEILLLPACIAAARAFALVWDGSKKSFHRPLVRTGIALALAANIAQHALAFVDFRHAQKRSSSPNQRLPDDVKKGRYYGNPIGAPPPANLDDYDVLLLAGYSDAFSQRGLVQWRERLQGWQLTLVRSEWSIAGYPFSTVETYHGPGFILMAQRTPKRGAAK